MKTTTKERKAGPNENEDIFDEGTIDFIERLIDDVDEATKMLKAQRDYWRAFSKANEHAPSGEVTIRSARLIEATLTTFLKEPSE